MFNSVGLNESPMVFLQSQYLTNPTPDFYQTYYELSSCVPTGSCVGIRGFWRWEAVKFGKFLGRRDNRLVIVKTMRQELCQVAARLPPKHSNIQCPTGWLIYYSRTKTFYHGSQTNFYRTRVSKHTPKGAGKHTVRTQSS